MRLCRGPDSVRVVDFVRKLHSKGRAQMVLGNHELNLMRGDRKHGCTTRPTPSRSNP